MWHKENLLNIGIKKLIDENFENIAWLDSDIVFENSFWVNDTIECLKENHVCQLFSIAEKIHHNHSTFHPSAVRSWKETGNILPVSQPYHTGYAWAAQSSILSQCNLYDKSITGGADSLIWLSSFAQDYNFSELIASHPIFQLKCKPYYFDFINWSKKWGSLVQSKVDYIYCNIKSLYHGNANEKQYISRYSILDKCKFDPSIDLIYNKEGALETKNKFLSKQIHKYLLNRKEDKKCLLQKLNDWLQNIELKQNQKKLEKKLKDKI